MPGHRGDAGVRGPGPDGRSHDAHGRVCHLNSFPVGGPGEVGDKYLMHYLKYLNYLMHYLNDDPLVQLSPSSCVIVRL